MPQIIRPDASTTRTPPAGRHLPSVRGQTTMHGCMDETAPVAADFTQCDAGSVGDALVVELASPSPTPGNDFNHVVGVCASKDSSGGAAVGFVCEFRQGYTNDTAASDSTANLDEALDTTETVVTVTDGTVFAAGDVIQIDSEEMIITSIASNDLTVTRGTGGTSATEHLTGRDVFDVNQGSLIVTFVCADVSDTVGASFYRYRLSTTEAARITDYTDLQLRFTSLNGRGGAPRSCRLHWAGVELPAAGDPSAHRKLTPEESRREFAGLSIHQESDRRPTSTTARPF